MRFKEKFGAKNGDRLTSIFGIISGWGFFLILIVLWISPQPRFLIPFLEDVILIVPLFNFKIPLIHLLISLPFISIGAYLGIAGVNATTLRVSETHKAVNIVDMGLYSKIRHPQYLGAILSHLGISILLSSLLSLFITPFIVLYNYVIAWKEEKELSKEFPKYYENYKKKVPMFFPRLRG
ncbi:MAG: methyltransferase family protein [Promethearchaeota archaeon]